MIKKELIPINLQFFAEDNAGYDDPDTLDGLLNDSDDGDDDDSGEQDDDSGEQNDDDSGEQDDDADDDNDDDSEEHNQKATQQAKQNHAYAEMRTQNKALTDVIKKFAQANKIEYKDVNELLSKLNDQTIELQSKEQNIPVEVLKRMDLMEKQLQTYQNASFEQAAYNGFQKLVDDYGLTQQELEDFASELDNQNMNPFVQNVDVIKEYRATHIEDIVRREVEKALKQDSQVDNSSSTPAKRNGKGTGGDDKLSTVNSLDKYLDQLTK